MSKFDKKRKNPEVSNEEEKPAGKKVFNNQKSATFKKPAGGYKKDANGKKFEKKNFKPYAKKNENNGEKAEN